ncbi:hypothetical protein OO013_03895 [Mangrovivirga sp. M17]|uniref:Tetratricopeptide repeat protein n=1 Tax=Mangrovivirga halotolerans TaxID=2993936 RepID=A0ABT3RMF1_9BACT|nr:hypothetical protein [Mangrovivirga halotolerans]MCX2742991.1 hypothetical protein [Mangrovivirga halotolerans]
MNRIKLLSALLISFTLFLSCQNQDNNHQEYSLGQVELDVTGEKYASQMFIKGLLLLHSFEYVDAREQFIEVQKEDPNLLMAYWGEAMTYNHTLWRNQDYEAGSEAISKALKNENFQSLTELEKDFITSVGVLYRSGNSKAERDELYSEYLQKMTEKYPGNQEVASFYSLSLLGKVKTVRNYEVFGQAAEIAKEVLKENPRHPGALHYLIHSYDDPDHARLAIEAANSYGKIAPDAAHALHMPSHIYVAMGMWDAVVEANERSYQASVDRKLRKDLDNDARGYHSYHWLQYGYLQQGKEDKAKEMVENMALYTKEKPSVRARAHLVYLKGTYLVETENWDSDIADIHIETEGLNISERAQYDFIEGMKAYKNKSRQTLEAVINLMQNQINEEKVKVNDTGVTICSGESSDMVRQSDVDAARSMEFQLRALLAKLDGDLEKTEKHLLKAVELEEKAGYNYGPPVIQKPSHEMLADWLVEQKRIDEAFLYYEQTLKRHPNRMKTVNSQQKLGYIKTM